MPSPISPETIAHLLQPYLLGVAVPAEVFSQLAVYLDLILKWNTRINLTAIRAPEEIVRRHFGESLFAGLRLDSHPAGSLVSIPACGSLLDLGSGAGFPGLPIQLLHPALPVALAESRTRKAAFLQEVIRTLALPTQVWADRAEDMPQAQRFHTVTLRAVDQMDLAVAEASNRASHRIMILGTRAVNYQLLLPDFGVSDPIALPSSRDGILLIAIRRSHS